MTFLEQQTKLMLILGNISTTEYSQANQKIALNNHYHDFIIEAVMADQNWNVQGEIATASIVANQVEYLCPLDLLTIKSIEANLTSGAAENEWTKLKIVDLRSISGALTNQQDAADTIDYAHEVRLYDESMFFNWLPENSVTNGLKIYYSKEATDLDGDSDKANLPNFLHMGMVYGAALDYAIETEQNRRIGTFKTLLDEKLRECRKYYSKRELVTRTKITTKQRRFR
jgi:hypothetical protein